MSDDQIDGDVELMQELLNLSKALLDDEQGMPYAAYGPLMKLLKGRISPEAYDQIANECDTTDGYTYVEHGSLDNLKID